MTDAAPPRPRVAAPYEKVVIAALAVLFLLGLCGYLYARLHTPSVLTREGMERTEAARRFASRTDLSTFAIRPLALRFVRSRSDSSIPDLYQAPLFSILAGTGIRLARHLGPNQGDKVAVALSLLCLAISAGACYYLARTLFGPDGAYLAALVYLLGANTLELALTPGPMPLAAALFACLLVALWRLDVLEEEGQQMLGVRRRPPNLTAAVIAGALWGLLFLALYSAILLLPIVLIYLWQVSRRDPQVVAAFLLTGLLVASPLFLRNYRLTGNPLFHLRFYELVMHTTTFPADSLYRTLGMDQPVASYLAGGGAVEVIGKTLGNVSGYWRSLPLAFGLMPLGMFLVSLMTRFTDSAMNRLRTLVVALLAVHVLGISPFFPYTDGVPILLMYAPVVAVMATTFFLNFVRARNLTPFSARLLRGAWIVFTLLPGTLFLLTAQAPEARISATYSALNMDLVQMPKLHAILAADSPWEAAYRLDEPAVWLPADSNEFRDTQNFLEHRITHIILTPGLVGMSEDDPAMDAWRYAYRFVSSFFTTLAAIDWRYQGQVGRRTRAEYPTGIAEALAGYRPQPVREPTDHSFSIVWWMRGLTAPVH